MTRPILSTLLILVIAMPLVSGALAQEPAAPGPWRPRNDGFAGGVNLHFPNRTFGTRTDTGYGLTGFYVRPVIPLITLTGSVGFSRFNGEGDLPAVDLWLFTGGLRFEFGAFFMGGEGGYFTEIDEGGFVPSMGLHVKRFEVSGRWKASGSSTWLTLRVGYYF